MFNKDLDEVRMIYSQHVQEEAELGRLVEGDFDEDILLLGRSNAFLLYLLNVHVWIHTFSKKSKHNLLA